MGVCPKCRRLYERDEADRVEATHSGPASEDTISDREDVAEPAVEEPDDSCPAAPADEKQALTNSERQQRHREKDPEGYRARNAERMRKRRKP